ncbi:MAG: peptidoglycan DD-metalloendopeptidase family protein [Chloroflexota bacterium]
MPTPYDGKIAAWFVYGGMVGERTIDELANTLKQYAPAVNAVFVKVTDGTDWMGTFESKTDPKPDLAINGPADINRWVSRLARYNLEFHAWALPKGINPEAEANLLLQACQQPGVRSLILDIEGGTNFFRGGKAAVRPLMLRLRGAIPGAYHIGLSVDPRPAHYAEVFPDEWFPFVNSVHPQVYWGLFGQTPDEALQITYDTWSKYGKPIIPVLQGHDIDRGSMDRARNLAIKVFNAPAVSWFALGGIGPMQFPAVNVTVAGSIVPPPPPPPPANAGKFGLEIIVTPDSPAYKTGTYNNAPNPMQTFPGNEGWNVKFAPTAATTSTVWAQWDPQLSSGGFWEIAAHVPSQHATTTNARYKINGILGQVGEFEAPIAQIPIDDLWVPLGIFNFAPNTPTAGVVQLTNATGESGVEIAFDAIRWRQVLGLSASPRYVADGFDSPLGSAADRKLPKIYPPIWYISNPYLNFYYLGPGNTNPAIHTGDDLILYNPATQMRQDAAHQPIFAIADGVVTSADRATGSWGNVIVIQHDPLITTKQIIYSRYGHVETLHVKKGDRVVRGQYIANVGNAFGRFVYHLHFDLSPTQILLTRPWDWPGLNKTRLEADYISPIKFISANRPVKP